MKTILLVVPIFLFGLIMNHFSDKYVWTRRINELLEINKSLAESEEKFQTMVHEYPNLIFTMNKESTFLLCEGGLQNQLLLSKEDFLGKKVQDVLPVEIAELFNFNLHKAYQNNEPVEFEYQLVINSLTKFYNAKLIPKVNDEMFVFISDITESYKLLKEVEQLSYNDQLTGLFNRRFLEVEYNRLNSKRNLPFTILALDVNGLKMINDAFGHASGDYLLCEVAKAIKFNLRSEDIVARMGGDEFVVLLPNTNASSAKKMIERIRSDVNSIEINGVDASIAIGFYTVDKESMVLDDILKNADESMYKEKNSESKAFRLNAVLSMQEKLIIMNESEKTHSEQVYDLVLKIGEAINLSKSELNDLGLSAKYHDIGKLGIPKEILLKNTTLTTEEYDKVKRHSEIGYQIIKSADSLIHIAESVLHHHENWDGSGYPNGLSGLSIPLYSRIIHVADAYESMIHFRPYKDQKTIEEATNELIEQSSKQFDPEVVTAFIKMLNS